MAKTPVEGGQGTLRSDDIYVVSGFGGLGGDNWENVMDVIEGRGYTEQLPKAACMMCGSEGLNVSEATMGSFKPSLA